MKARDLAIALAVSAGAAVAGFATYRHFDKTPSAPEIRPDVSLNDLDGKPHRLSEWNGKLVLLNFWATWCAPCIQEIPMLVRAQADFGARGLQLVGVAMDDVEPVKSMSARLAINYPVLAGGADVSAAMDALGNDLGALPFSVLIAPDGRILKRQAGALKPSEIKEWLENLPS